MVGRNGNQITVESARAPPEYQIVEAVALSRHHDQDPGWTLTAQHEGHPIFPGKLAELGGELLGVLGAYPKGRAQKQLAAACVVELLVLDDVTVVFEEPFSALHYVQRTFDDVERHRPRRGRTNRHRTRTFPAFPDDPRSGAPRSVPSPPLWMPP